jgi:hypothetical protein
MRFLIALAVLIAAATVVFAVSRAVPQSRQHAEQAATPAPVEHAALADGWQAAEISAADETYSLRANDVSGTRIGRETSFVLESAAGDLDPGSLASRLRVEPAFDFHVQGNGGGRLTIKPASPLREEMVYRFTLIDPADQHEVHAWAFQTDGPLRIVQTLPADRATNVPLDTGIELTLSHDGVTGVEGRFSISPQVEGRFEIHKRVVVFVPKQLAGC